MVLIRILFGILCGAGFFGIVWWSLIDLVGIGRFFPAVANVSVASMAIVGACIGAAAQTVAWALEQRRLKLNRAAALERSLSFSETLPDSELRSWPAVSLFRHNNASANLRMTGQHQNRAVDVFDLTYTVSSQGEHSNTTRYSQTAFRFSGAGRNLPRFQLHPRGFFTGLLSSISGTREIELHTADDADPESTAACERFGRNYHLIAGVETDPKGVRLHFHKFVIGWLAMRPEWSIEANGEDLVAWKKNRLIVGADRFQMLDELHEFLTLVQATDVAAARAVPLQASLKPRVDVGATLGLVMGAMIGLVLGSVAAAFALSQIPFLKNTGATATWALVFVSAAIFAVLGALAGRRLGPKLGIGRAFAR